MKRVFKKIVCVTLALVMLVGMLPQMTLQAKALEENEAVKNELAGKTVSILGDSISTFGGVSNNTNSNSTIGSNDTYYSGQGGISRGDTWWQQVFDVLDMELLVNNSWSGSCVFQPRKGEASVGYTERCVNLHNDHTGEEPDIILVFLGTNDYKNYPDTVGTEANVDYDAIITENGDGTYTYATAATTCEAYAIMLHKMSVRYPDADIYCMSLLPRKTGPASLTKFNHDIAIIAERFGCSFVDFENCGITPDVASLEKYMYDGKVHPNAEGMDLMSQAVLSVLLGEETTIHDVDVTLTNVFIDNNDHACIDNTSYSATLKSLNVKENISVAITMGGEDITASAYNNGNIFIENVTGDIEIVAFAERGSIAFRWEFSNGELVSVADDEYTMNVLTKQQGSSTNGIFEDTYYRTQHAITLSHDKPWILEWRGAGSGGFMLSDATSAASGSVYFRRHTVGYLHVFGMYDGSKYNHYGVKPDDHGIDAKGVHTYRMENRIDADGRNMVYFFVDGVEIGAMNNYYVGYVSQGTTDNWISGKDFCINYVGTSTHPLDAYSMEYLQVWECGETAESMSMRYDDHLDMTGKTVEIIDAGKPTSYQVGYGVEENTVLDTAVVTLNGDTLVATGIGTAKVIIDGQLYDVSVEKAKINLIVIMGQSNAGNHFENATSDVTCPIGTTYLWGDGKGTIATEPVEYTQPSKGFHTPLLAELYAQSVAAGDPVKNVLIWQEGITSKNGQSIVKWAASATNTSGTDATVTMIQNCRNYYEKHSDLYEIVNSGVYWLQGESDTDMDPALYTQLFMAMWERLENAGMEYLAFLRPRWGVNGNGADHQDLHHSASLSAQIKMINENPNFYMATDLTENWVGTETMVHTVDISKYITVMEAYGVNSTYTDAYGNNATYVDGKLTTTMKSLYGSNNKCHYGKFGYGLIGADAAYNMYHALRTNDATIVVTDTSGHANRKKLLTDGQQTEIDITNMSDDLSFRPGCGSVAGTLEFIIRSGKEDITHHDGLLITSGLRYGSICVSKLRNYENVSIEIIYNTENGQKHTAVCNVNTQLAGPKKDYIWDFNEDLNARDEDGNILNSFLQEPMAGSYTLENGYLTGNNLMLQLDRLIELETDKNWCVEWKYGTFANGPAGFLLCEESTNCIGNKAFYHTNTGRLMISDYADKKGYRNYTSSAVAIEEYDCIRITNHYDPTTGKSKLSLWKNGECVIENFQMKGSLNSDTDNLDMTGYPLEGNFAFGYLGHEKNPLWGMNCQLDYLQVQECVHTYESGICTACGAEHPNLANYEGKVISILGDSISTFAGYIPTADGFNLEHYARYPQDNLLTDVNETWWMQVINKLNVKLGINDSWRSTEVYNYINDEVNSTYDGTKACMASLTRIQNLGSNGTPDVILFYGGTNDITQRRTVGTFDSATAPTEVDLTSVKWDTVADAYVTAIMRMKYYYPDAQIVAMLPTYTYKNTDAVLEEYNSVFAAICEYYGVTYIDLRNCGISTTNLPDGTHPDAEGMDYITEAVLDTLLMNCQVKEGKHTVHSVNHKLTGAESSLSYYKGVSHGKSFVTTITGEDVMVSVTMGGVDITDKCYTEGVVTIEMVTGDLLITATGKERPIYADNLQQLPDNICSGTNLWSTLIPENQYYTASGWGNLSNGQAWSVTIPVNTGDKIFATSFQKYGENGNTSSASNGIRVTYFDEEGVLKALTPAQTYTEYTDNGGYIVVPEGAVAVNVPMWTNSDECKLYILNKEHSYSGITCTICGAEHSNLANYEGKVISILGDSISTFAGYIPVADGFNLEHLARYPQDNLLTEVNETWWMQVINQLDAKLGINDSWRGATVSGAKPVTSGTTGENAAMSNLIRIQNLGSNGTPDIILFYGGTNDLAHVEKVGTFDSETAPSEVDLNTTKWDNLADGYVNTLLRLKHYYPEAEIIAMLPTYTTSYYSNDKLANANEVLAQICEYYDVTYVDLRNCGISTKDLPDGIHPDAAGMDYISSAVQKVLLEQCEIERGENVVYSVTHVLSGAESSLGYYKGVSHGQKFTTIITGDELDVTITMGGVDITDSVYDEGVVNIPYVTGDIAVHAKGKIKPVYSDYLQELPTNVCAGMNLWKALSHDKEYYTVDGWGVHSTGVVRSVTIPINPGDQLWATSFQKSGMNGGTMNGIRLTWFDENDVLDSMSADRVYNEFSTKGYLTAPEGAVAVNVVMWNSSDDNELYILNREHSYNAAATALTCTICGTEHPNAVNFEGKVISIMGGSTCTFDGYIPVADGFNLEHRARYPQDNLLTEVNDTWWMQLITQLNAKLGINESWAGSQVLNTIDGNSGDLGKDAAMASLTRIQNLGSNGTPNIILFYGAMNDIGRAVTLGTFDAQTAPNEVDLTATKWESLADAYVAAIMRMQHYYPDTEIIAMLPGYTASYYTAAELDKYSSVLAEICNHYGVKYIDLRNSGQTINDLPDGIHPDAEGMDYITDAVLKHLLSECTMEIGENVVYSVTHNLTNITASLGYYKGVSAGESFAEILTADNDMAVTVTMNGVDITDTCYADGKVTIPSVTGDLVITAEAKYTLGERLQQLPDNICEGTNIWTILEPVNEYYTANGWGVTGAGKQYSVTFPIITGDQIWATSFGTTAVNGFSANGVRITWFSEDGVLESVTRDKVYEEFAANGYVTVPEGAVAVNIPMASNSDEWELYILNKEHSYDDWIEITAPTCDTEGQDKCTCALCGEMQFRDTRISGDSGKILVSNPLPEDYFEGKILMAIGDSLTAGTGVTSEQRYHHLTAQELGMTNINSGTSGATLCPGGHLPNKFETLMNADLLKKRGVDVVTIFLGINDWDNGVVNGTYQGKLKYDESLTYYDLGEFGTDDTTTIYGAAKMWCERIKELQSEDGCEHIQFVFATPVITSYNKSVTYAKDWNQDKTNVFGYTLRQYCNAIMEVCAYYEIPVLDLNMYSGMYYHSEEDNNVDYFGGDGIHPGVNGHAMMANALTEFLLEGYTYEEREVSDCGHNYEDVVIEPTCTEGGYTTHRCPECYYSYVDNYKEAAGHSYEETVTEPTCIEQGYTTHTCENCDDSYVDAYVTKLGHSFTTYISDGNATCTTDGTKTAKCERCDDTDTMTDIGSANGHSYGEWSEVTVATCEDVGEERRDCNVCDVYETREIKATGHAYKETVTAPTCTEQGYTTHTCANCKDSYVDNYVAKLNHSFTNYVSDGSATCTTDGTKTAKCDRCDETNTVADEGSATGHSYGEWYIISEATYEADGEEGRECTACGDKQTRKIPMLVHEYESVITEPTCTEQGYTTHTCTKCGDVYVDTYEPALGHKYTEEITPPTVTEQGYTTYTCTVCGDSYKDNFVGITGFIQTDGGYYFYNDGEIDTTINGLTYMEERQQWLYIESGKWIENEYGLVEYNGSKFFVANGVADMTISGLQLIGDNFYFLAYGLLQDQYTGLAYYDGEWFYVEEGVLAIDFNGIQDYDGSKFLIAAGRVLYSYSGLYMAADENWYFISYGQVQTQYTGLVEYDGAWFYIEEGVLAKDFCGNVEYDGAQFEVVYGGVVVA